MAVEGGKLLRIARLAPRAARFALREPGSALIAARMAAWVAALSVLVKILPLPRALAIVAPRPRVRRSVGDAVEAQARLARLLDLVLAADFLVFTPTCWKRAPVLHRFLALSGIETRILFGVRAGAGESQTALDGHAWLEAGGEALLENSPPDYKVTFSFPA